MALEIKRLHLASVTPPGTRAQWPVHGFVVSYPGGAALVDTGVGGPQGLQDDWRVVNVAGSLRPDRPHPVHGRAGEPGSRLSRAHA